MKVGILTVPFNNNYGGYLQAFALMKVLKDMGHEPVIIMRRHNERSVNLVVKAKYFFKGIVLSFHSRRLCLLVYGKEKEIEVASSYQQTDAYLSPNTRNLFLFYISKDTTSYF